MVLTKKKIILILLSVFLDGCSMFVTPPKLVSKPVYSAEQIREQIINVKENIQTKPVWLFPIDVCPVDVMPQTETFPNYPEENCDQNPLECYERCKNENGNACYGLAITLQKKLGIELIEAEALHLRACKLGVVSGCTNRAAAKLNLEADNSESVKCSVDTFEKTCEKDDPWGCYMYGYVLAYGKGIEENLDKSLSVLSKACKYGIRDEACKSAQELEKQILDFKNLKREHTIKNSNK